MSKLTLTHSLNLSQNSVTHLLIGEKVANR